MDSTETASMRENLAQHLSTPARQILYAAVDQAYADAGKLWRPEAGCTLMWYGLTTWTFVTHRIREAAEADPSLGIEILGGMSGAFRMKIGPYLIAPYGCGYRKPEDPRQHFPNNDKGAGLLAEINLDQLDFFPQFSSAPTALVLAHYGNHEGGLEALYLKEPRGVSMGRIDRWGYVEPLYEIGSGAARVVPAADSDGASPLPVLPGPVKVVRPTVLPFRKKPAAQEGTEGA